MNNWLKDVIELSIKRSVVKGNRERPLHSMKNSILDTKNNNYNPIIAEYKRSSPSGFLSNRDYANYVNFLKNYVAGFSVLTEEKYFNGSYTYLKNIGKLTNKPILMKDFIVTDRQIESAYNLGADVILLIIAILKENEIEYLLSVARSYKLEVLVEVHNINELNVALNYNIDMIGVNSRNLFDLSISLNNTKKLLQIIPKKFIKVAESGIKNKDDIKVLKESRADAFLIGTSLMENPNLIKNLI